MKTTRVGMAILLLCAGGATAQHTNRSSVADTAGARASLGTATNLSAAGQPGGIETASNGRYMNRAGFLNTFFLQPSLDHDGDGLPDEADADNDNDMLSDAAELDGTAFRGSAVTDPNAADSDRDGMDDAAESAAMFDPWDPGHRLTILSLTPGADGVTVRWIGRAGGTVNILEDERDLRDGRFTNVVYSAAVGGGTGPWYKATNAWMWVPSTTSRFLRVRSAAPP